MHPDWQHFLTTQGAHLQDDAVQHFGEAAAERIAARDDTILCDLSHYGILKVSGEEAQNFLHNLLSSDVHSLTPRAALRSSFNTAKGRTLATLFIWRNGQDFFLHLPRGLCAAILKKLSMYVLRTKVRLENASAAVVCLGISGTHASTALPALFGELPQDILGAVPHENGTLIRLDTHRFQLCTTPGQAVALWPRLSAFARPAGSPCWDWLEIRAGIPAVYPPTQELFVPQTLNLDLIGAINFKKGCYPGQEVVARLHYLGKPKRRMFLAHIDSNEPPAPGTPLFSMENTEKSCGEVVRAARAPEGGCDLLAGVQIVSHDAFPVHLGTLTGVRLRFEPLPYTIP